MRGREVANIGGGCTVALLLGAAWLLGSSESSARGPDAGERMAALESAIGATRREIQRIHDSDEVENLVAAYGYYLDKALWNNLADLFATDGSIEIGTRGRYVGRERIRAFLMLAYGKSGPREGVLSNHMQLQPVIDVAPDGRTAKARIRLLYQTGRYGESANWGGGVYENEYVKNDGVWQIKSVKSYTTFVADYEGGWAKNPRQLNAEPSKNFPPDVPPGPVVESFPHVYDIPFHYDNPVTHRVTPVRPDRPTGKAAQ